ncbi:hypothetical protein [Kutzneria sp. NPDC052558]|uniref:hypothetical protein n=1 Tax=Kutzneria sp. NPDC052558 TaxID=3364121 RepID=UPI0037C8AEF0
MRVVLSGFDSRGGVEPSAALAVALRPARRARAAVVAGTIRGDGASKAANLLLEP